MSNLLGDRLSSAEHEHPRERGLDRYDPEEVDAPEPLQMFTRLGVLLMIAFGFGLAVELLARLPPQ